MFEVPAAKFPLRKLLVGTSGAVSNDEWSEVVLESSKTVVKGYRSI